MVLEVKQILYSYVNLFVVGSNPAFTSDFSINKWVYASFRTNKLPSGDASFMLRGYNATNPEPLKFYLDNITVAELKLRP